MHKPNRSAEIHLQIPFHDVDMMEIVWHGHYAKYFEIARCAVLDQIGYNYVAMRDSGYAWPIIDLRIRYVKPAGFGPDCVKTQNPELRWNIMIELSPKTES